MATLRAGLSEKGKAWLQQEVAAKAKPQLRALAQQLDVRQWVAGSNVTKADLAAAVVEKLCPHAGSKSGEFCWCLFCCADCCQEPSSSAASPTPVSRPGRSRCLTLLFLMMFCGWPKCKHQMAPCRVSYGRLPHLMDMAG